MSFVIGKVYRRRELHEQYGGQRQGGISTPAGFPYIFLFTGEQGNQYGYYDGFQSDGMYWYTGEGQTGAMEMVRGNRAIQQHQSAGKELHLFEYVQIGHVRYLGQAYYAGHHVKIVADRDGNPRQAIVFELTLEPDEGGEADLLPDEAPRESGGLWRESLGRLREMALAASTKTGDSRKTQATAHFRSEAVRVYVLKRAAGFCEGCGNQAPFATPKGAPYLEPHHIRRRADSGPDHPAWVIALCPNCHRRVHHGADGHDYNTFLAKQVKKIENDLLLSL